METAPRTPEKSEEDHALEYLIDHLGEPGFEPETIAFLIDHPEYEHKPVGIREFIESERYLNAKSRVWPEVVDELERIFDAEPTSGKLSTYREVVLDMGIGSGKSYRVSAAFAYAVYRLLCYKCPQGQFSDMAPDSVIAIMNMSLSKPQAKRTVFGETASIINASPWFQQFALPDPRTRSELKFPKHVVIFPGSSSETAPLGYNIYVCNMDEAAFYTQTDDKDAAAEIYDAMYGRVTSRFGESGLIFATSSPRYVDDFIEKKLDEASTNARVYGRRCATWENKPSDIQAIKAGETFKLQHPRERDAAGVARLVDIPIKYQDAFRRNRNKAWRDFGAVASLALDPYFGEEEYARLAGIVGAGWYNSPDLSNLSPEPAEYAVHVDIGLKRDALGFCLAKIRDDGGADVKAILRVVCAKRAEQLRKKNEPFDLVIGHDQVQLEEVRQIIYRLTDRGFFIGSVSFDGFQSIDSIQQLQNRGYDAKMISCDRDMKAYDTFKDFVNTGRFTSCRHDFFLLECSRLEQKDGKKVDHPPSGSKDLADAVSGVCRAIAELMGESNETELIISDDSARVEITGEI